MSKSKVFAALLLATIPFTGAQALSTKYTGSCSVLAKETGKYPDRKVSGFKNPATFKKMTTANQLMADGQKAQAKAILMEIKNSSSDKFALSIVNQYLARLAFEDNNFNQTVQYAKEVVQLDALPVKSILQMKKQVAWAYLGKKDFKNAISWMQQYFDQVINPPVSDYKALAQLYYQDNNFRSAICPAYIALTKTTKKKDKESLYKMLFGLHYNLKDMAGSATILSEMINYYPDNKKYWEQLFSIQYQRGKEADALAIYELAYKKGLWTTAKEYKNLASMHSNSGAPMVAAKVLEEGFSKGVVPKNLENLKLLARFYDTAKERDAAIKTYDQLSGLSNSGEFAYKIGLNYYEEEKYQQAIKYFQEAIRKGNLKSVDRGYSYLQMGAAQFYLGNESAAIAALNKAKDIDKTRKNATSWIAFIRQKQDIREQLKKDAEALEAEVAAEANQSTD
ncbi:MAG: hypothetical protein HWE16_01290 [Gammaproteobacteria bacterium]|nr:hypothetical protein [Gammaproteobacteria bacterium]